MKSKCLPGEIINFKGVGEFFFSYVKKKMIESIFFFKSSVLVFYCFVKNHYALSSSQLQKFSSLNFQESGYWLTGASQGEQSEIKVFVGWGCVLILDTGSSSKPAGS